MFVVKWSKNVIHLQGENWRETAIYISYYISSAYAIKVKPKAGNSNKI